MTTGSLMPGLVDGMARGANYASDVAAGIAPKGGINYVRENPNNVLTAQTGSDIAHDIVNDHYYMALAQNGSTWVHLKSGTNP